MPLYVVFTLTPRRCTNWLLHSDVRIVFFFHFESNQIEYWTIIRNFESNRIVFTVLKSSAVKFVFFLKCELQLLKFELNSKFVCVLDPEECEINFCALLPASCMCNGPPKLRYWACQSASLWLCAAVAVLQWFF